MFIFIFISFLYSFFFFLFSRKKRRNFWPPIDIQYYDSAINRDYGNICRKYFRGDERKSVWYSTRWCKYTPSVLFVGTYKQRYTCIHARMFTIRMFVQRFEPRISNQCVSGDTIHIRNDISFLFCYFHLL